MSELKQEFLISLRIDEFIKAPPPKAITKLSFFINISSYDNDIFQATLQVQSSRPIYNSSYNSPVYNFNDKNFTFR